MSETQRLINRVRDAGYGLFTLPEKQRLHDAASRYRRNGKISADDLAWLRQCDNNFRFIDAMRGKGSP